MEQTWSLEAVVFHNVEKRKASLDATNKAEY
jgi:hypothetical protein